MDGRRTLTVDGVLNKSLVLSRGQEYLFIIDKQDQLGFIFTEQSTEGGAGYIDNGLYSVIDGTMNKKYVFFIPNNTTPEQLFYTSGLPNVGGIGGVKISGGFDYAYGAQFLNNVGTGGNTTNINSSFSGGFYGGSYSGY